MARRTTYHSHDDDFKSTAVTLLRGRLLFFNRRLKANLSIIQLIMKSVITLILAFSPIITSAQVAIEEHEPQYPMHPVCVDDSGDILLSFYIMKSGKPHMIELENTDSKRFIRSAIKTLLKYKFQKDTFNTNEKYFKAFSFKAPYLCVDS